ncbi:formate/nitrite transporter family protein [Xanthobacteraceae bacterium A53D]
MSDNQTLPKPAVLVDEVFSLLEEKSRLPLGAMITLGILAGVYIGLGGMFATVVLAGADALPYGIAQLLAGAAFSTGLALVLIAGAELFTGNMLMAGPVVARRIEARKALMCLFVVYLANLAGSLLIGGLVFAAGVHEAGDGQVGRAALELGVTKIGNGFWPTLASAAIANMLVCLAVWLGYSGRTVTQRIIGIFLPISAFVAAGLEHSVANMYLLPYAWMVQTATGNPEAALTVVAITGNLVPATIGNVLGGALIALAYFYAYASGDEEKDGSKERAGTPAPKPGS